MMLKMLVGVLVVFAAILEATTSVSPLVLAGLLLVFAGERFFHEDTTYWGFVGGGFIVLLASIGLRVRRMTAAQAARKAGEQRALGFGWRALLPLQPVGHEPAVAHRRRRRDRPSGHRPAGGRQRLPPQPGGGQGGGVAVGLSRLR